MMSSTSTSNKSNSNSNSSNYVAGDWGWKVPVGTTMARIWHVFPNTKRQQEVQLHFKVANGKWESERCLMSKFYKYPNPNDYQRGLIMDAKESYRQWTPSATDFLLKGPNDDIDSGDCIQTNKENVDITKVS